MCSSYPRVVAPPLLWWWHFPKAGVPLVAASTLPCFLLPPTLLVVVIFGLCIRGKVTVEFFE
jgi:hypothetical protein